MKQTDKLNSSIGVRYRMPAEWEPHEATWLAWPHNRETWPGQLLRDVCDTYLKILEILLDSERVHLLVQDEKTQGMVKRLLRQAGVSDKNLFFHQVLTEDVWIRDYGPIFIKSRTKGKAWCKWIFNAWGEKYKDHLADNHVFPGHSTLIPYPCLETGIVLEGGAIEVNGWGVCLTTEQCLLHPSREPHRNREKVETYLRDFLGIQEVVWLKGGICGDDTDGHIDNLARFVAPDVILVSYEEDPSDDNYGILSENWRRVIQAAAGHGNSWKAERLPMPGKMIIDHIRHPASYANFYICNKAVLAPVFGDRHDQRATAILKEHFPSREVIPISSRALVYGLGAIHCMTQQEPA